jgi:hypothetical protein
VVDSFAEENPAGGSNAKRAKALETAYGCVRGRKLWRANPKSGSGRR